MTLTGKIEGKRVFVSSLGRIGPRLREAIIDFYTLGPRMEAAVANVERIANGQPPGDLVTSLVR